MKKFSKKNTKIPKIRKIWEFNPKTRKKPAKLIYNRQKEELKLKKGFYD